MKWMALHGVPMGPRTWERLSFPVETHAFEGIATPRERRSWALESFVAEIEEKAKGKVLIGHDFGGVIAAMTALRVDVKAVVLTGTALGPWWGLTRLSASPALRSFFYDRFEGRLFTRLGGGGKGPVDKIPDLAHRMQRLAREMSPPRGLAKDLAARCPVHLIWGRRDPWYPIPVAMALARSTNATIHWIAGRHYCMRSAPVAFNAALESIDSSLDSVLTPP